MRKADPQRDVEQRRKRYHRQRGPERNVEFQAEMHHQNGGELAEHGKPAQPHQRFEPHVLGPVLNSRQTKHAANVAMRRGLSKQRPARPLRAQGCQASCSVFLSIDARATSITAMSARSTSRTPSPLAAEMTNTSCPAARRSCPACFLISSGVN